MSFAQENQSVPVGATLGASGAISYANWDSGMIAVPSGSSITSLTWHVSSDGETYFAAYDSGGSAVTQTVAATRAYPIPAALTGAMYLKAVGNAAGTIHVSKKA